MAKPTKKDAAKKAAKATKADAKSSAKKADAPSNADLIAEALTEASCDPQAIEAIPEDAGVEGPVQTRWRGPLVDRIGHLGTFYRCTRDRDVADAIGRGGVEVPTPEAAFADGLRGGAVVFVPRCP